MSAGDYPDWSSTQVVPRVALQPSPVVVPAGTQVVKNYAIDASMYGVGIAFVAVAGATRSGSFIVVGHETGTFYTSDVVTITHDGFYAVPGFSSGDKSIDVTMNAADTNTTFWVDALRMPVAVFTEETANPLTVQGVNVTQAAGNGLAIPPTSMAFSLPVALPTDQVPAPRLVPAKLAHNAYVATGAHALIPNGIGAATYVWSISVATNNVAGQSLVGFLLADGTDVLDVDLSANSTFAWSGKGALWTAQTDISVRVNVYAIPAGGAIYVTAEYSQV
jgi:hypothetical protein